MSIKTRPQIIIFDAVGTLIHPRPAVAEVYERIGQRYGSKRRASAIGELFHRAFHKQDQIDRDADWRTDESREKRRWRAVVESVLSDVCKKEPCFLDLFEHFARPEAWVCGDDVAAVLESLAREDYRLAIASNYDRRLRSVVAGLDDLKPVHEIFVSSEIGWRKPSVRFFHALVEQTGAQPDRILYVGDDYANDMLGAQAAGLQAWLYSPLDRGLPGQIASLTALVHRF
jgi:putative hydrolase of the HAD superfamily